MPLQPVGHRILVRPTTSRRLSLKLRPGRNRTLSREMAQPTMGRGRELRSGKVAAISSDPEFKTNLKAGDSIFFRDDDFFESVPDEQGNELLVMGEFDVVVKEG